MTASERVHRAIEDPVESATKLLDEATDADIEARLMMLINGWGRGIAAGLEELANAVEQVGHSQSSPAVRGETEPQPPSGLAPHAKTEQSAEAKAQAEPKRSEDAEIEDEEGLLARAEESHAATVALREEASGERDDDGSNSDGQ